MPTASHQPHEVLNMATTPASIKVDVTAERVGKAVTAVKRMGALACTDSVLHEVLEERQAQDAKWGEQNHPDGTGPDVGDDGIDLRRAAADQHREHCQRAAALGLVSWADILEEEVAEALAESDPAKLRTELVQVAAVAVAWVEALDRRLWAKAVAEVESDTHAPSGFNDRCGDCGSEWHGDRCGRWCESNNPGHWCSDCLSYAA